MGGFMGLDDMLVSSVTAARAKPTTRGDDNDDDADNDGNGDSKQPEAGPNNDDKDVSLRACVRACYKLAECIVGRRSSSRRLV